jgi:hypothetical protein
MSDGVVNSVWFTHVPYHTVIAADLDEAVAIHPIIGPDLVVSQPAFYCVEKSHLLKAIQMQRPVQPIIVWGSDVIVPLFRETCRHPAPVRYVPMPFDLDDIVRQARNFSSLSVAWNLIIDAVV